MAPSAAPGISPEAVLVLDNSLLVLLTEYFCDRHSSRLPMPMFLDEAKGWMSLMLSVLQKYSPGKVVHSPAPVLAEYKPISGRMPTRRDIDYGHCEQLRQHVCSRITSHPVDLSESDRFKTVPGAPKKLVGGSGVSPNDFSLLSLGLDLGNAYPSVYVLTRDEDLLSYISWLRTSREARRLYPTVSRVEGLCCLTYMEAVHRLCNIPSELMVDILSFAMTEHYARHELIGTEKGRFIMHRLTELMRRVNESSVWKGMMKTVSPGPLFQPAGVPAT